MRGSIHYQTISLFKEIDQIGESRYQLKSEAREEGFKGSSELASQIGITSYNTASTYIPIWENLGNYAKEEFKVKNFEKLTPEIVEAFLRDKAEGDCSWSSLTIAASACQKLSVALNQHSENFAEKFGREVKTYDWNGVVKTVRDEYRDILERNTESRRYADPKALIEAIGDPKFQLAAEIQLESGVRITEMSLIKEGQLRGEAIDKHTDKEIAQFAFQGKGGYKNVGNLTRETYEKLEAYIKEQGEFKVDQNEYRDALKTAANLSEQAYNGSHGLRWDFTASRVLELQEAGMKYEAALSAVSKELSHHRISITRYYLR